MGRQAVASRTGSMRVIPRSCIAGCHRCCCGKLSFQWGTRSAVSTSVCVDTCLSPCCIIVLHLATVARASASPGDSLLDGAPDVPQVARAAARRPRADVSRKRKHAASWLSMLRLCTTWHVATLSGILVSRSHLEQANKQPRRQGNSLPSSIPPDFWMDQALSFEL